VEQFWEALWQLIYADHLIAELPDGGPTIRLQRPGPMIT